MEHGISQVGLHLDKHAQTWDGLIAIVELENREVDAFSIRIVPIPYSLGSIFRSGRLRSWLSHFMTYSSILTFRKKHHKSQIVALHGDFVMKFNLLLIFSNDFLPCFFVLLGFTNITVDKKPCSSTKNHVKPWKTLV